MEIIARKTKRVFLVEMTSQEWNALRHLARGDPYEGSPAPDVYAKISYQAITELPAFRESLNARIEQLRLLVQVVTALDLVPDEIPLSKGDS